MTGNNDYTSYKIHTLGKTVEIARSSVLVEMQKGKTGSDKDFQILRRAQSNDRSPVKTRHDGQMMGVTTVDDFRITGQ